MSLVPDLARSTLIFAFFLLSRKTWWLADMGCPEPALHVAPTDGPGGADGRRPRRRGRCRYRIKRALAVPDVRAATTARKKTLEAEILKEASP